MNQTPDCKMPRLGFQVPFLATIPFLFSMLTVTWATFAAEPAPPVASPPPAADAAGAQTADPRIVVDQTTYDFGKVESGQLVKHDFVFTNTGAALLEISDVRPGCGCTTAGAWDKKVEPGKS